FSTYSVNVCSVDFHFLAFSNDGEGTKNLNFFRWKNIIYIEEPIVSWGGPLIRCNFMPDHGDLIYLTDPPSSEETSGKLATLEFVEYIRLESLGLSDKTSSVDEVFCIESLGVVFNIGLVLRVRPRKSSQK